MFNIGTQELILILVIALVVFGPGKLPEVGKAIGKGINEFKDAVAGKEKVKKEVDALKEGVSIDAKATNNRNDHPEKDA